MRSCGVEVHEGVGGTGVVGVLRNGDDLAQALETLQAIEAAADGDRVIENACLAARFIADAIEKRRGEVVFPWQMTLPSSSRPHAITPRGASRKRSFR